MGLDDLVENEKDEEDKEKAETLSDELGIESKEELEELDDRISRLYESHINNDKRIESLEDDVALLMSALSKTMKEVVGEKMKDELEESDGANENRNGFEW